jgi:hypothetical protein
MLMKKRYKDIFNIDEHKKKIILYIYAAICFLLNFIRIFDNAFWGDEGFTIRLANMSIPRMLSSTAEDVHPPLYYLIVMGIRYIGGNHGPVYHLASIIPFGIFVCIAATYVRKRFGYIATTILITFASFTTAALTYNVEVRMYSWASLFVFLSWIFILDIMEESRWRDWILFTVFSILAAYTHYYALLAVALFYLMLFIRIILYHRTRDTLLKLFTSIGLTIAAYIPWLKSMLDAVYNTAGDSYWIQNKPEIRYMLTFLFESKWLVLIAAVVILAYFFRQFRTKQKCRTTEFEFELFGYFCTAGVIAISETVSLLVHPVLLARYLFTISSVVWLLFGTAISGLKYRKQIFCFVFAATMFFCIPAYVKLFSYDYQLNQDTAAFEQNVLLKDNDVILTNRSHFDWTLLDYYYPRTPHALLQNADTNNITEMANSLASGKEKEGIWLFWSDPLTKDASASLKVAGYNIEQYYFGRLGNGEKLYVYKLRLLSAGSRLQEWSSKCAEYILTAAKPFTGKIFPCRNRRMITAVSGYCMPMSAARIRKY